MLALPPGSLATSKNCVPALSDNGASFKTSCAKTLDGAILESYSKADAGTLSVGDEGARLESKGSYIYIYERFGSDGSGELVARRMKHTPSLHLPIVFSEATEVYRHGYTYQFSAAEGRLMTTSDGQRIPLHISASKLGWLRTRPITDKAQALKALKVLAEKRLPASETLPSVAGSGGTRRDVMPPADGTLAVLGDGTTSTQGMPKRELRGAELLRRAHIVNAHCSMRKLLLILKHLEIPSGRVTKDDVQQFQKEGCGSCESAKMQARSFSRHTLVDPTKSQPGKRWVSDSLKLRVPSAEHGWVKVYIAICATSFKKVGFGMHGETVKDIEKADNMLRAFVRPTHGDIYVWKRDAHPTHRSLEMSDIMADSQTRSQIAPPHLHTGAGLAENMLRWGVPAANALLMGTPDLGEAHFPTAFFTAIAASDYAPTTDEPDKSPNMMYYGKSEWMHNPLLIYGSSCKALTHLEARSNKYEHHSFPAIYTGPAIESDSAIHCSVWAGRYIDVDVGCVNVDERNVIARTARDHPSHQPYNQDGSKPRATVIDTRVWYDPSKERHPADIAADAVAAQTQDTALPLDMGEIWLSSMPPPQGYFSINLGSGSVRAGDITSFVHRMLPGTHVQIRVDEKVGGYEQRWDIPRVEKWLTSLTSMPTCIGLFMQLTCGPYSVVKFADGPGPKPIFTSAEPDGVKMANGTLAEGVMVARQQAEAAMRIAEPVLRRGAAFFSEHPREQGVNSDLPVKGLEQHSGLHSTKVFKEATATYGLMPVITDLCMSGHAKQKATDFLCSPVLYGPMQREFGHQRCDHEDHPGPQLIERQRC